MNYLFLEARSKTFAVPARLARAQFGVSVSDFSSEQARPLVTRQNILQAGQSRDSPTSTIRTASLTSRWRCIARNHTGHGPDRGSKGLSAAYEWGLNGDGDREE
jgi:hypothetical protein